MKQKQYESGTKAAQVKELIKLLGGDMGNPNDLAAAETLADDIVRAREALGSNFRGLLRLDSSRKNVDQAYLEAQVDGTIHLDPFSRKFFVKKSDPVRLEPIDQFTLKEIVEEQEG